MSVQDLVGYHFQLSQVTEALERNPDNSELVKLQSDLKELISLAESLCNVEQGASRPTSTEKRKNLKSANDSCCKWSIGQTVKARWENRKFYTATIETLPESKPGSDNLRVAVRFKDYNDVEYVDINDIRESSPDQNTVDKEITDDSSKLQNHNASVVVPHVPVTPATTAAISNSTARPKKKYKPKNVNVPTVADNYQTSKQQAWLTFLSSSTGLREPKTSKRKAVSAAPLIKPVVKKPSMFSTSDHPSARVGVIGSGKPMTQFHQRGKHIFPLKS